MNSSIPASNERKSLLQIRLRNVVVGVLVKEKTRIFLMFAYLFVNSALIYWLSSYLVDRTAYQVYTNPTIILYFRLLVMSTPLVIGLLIGVPLLSSEYESGTYRFLFTQGVGRLRLVRTTFGIYFVLIVLFSAMTIISINHFLTVQMTAQSISIQSAQSISIWSFGVFVCHPIIMIPLTIAAFVTGVFLGILTKRAIAGIAVTMLFGIAFALGLKAFFDKLLSTLVQGLYDSTGNVLQQHYDFYGNNDPKYLFQFQILFASLLTIITIVLVFGSLRALNSEGLLHRKLKPS